MKISRALRFSAILLTAVGFSSLIATGKLPWFAVLSGLFGLMIGLIQTKNNASKRRPTLTPALWNTIVLFAFVASIADFILGSREPLPALSYVLVALMLNKLTVLRSAKDFQHLFVISFLMVLSAAVLTVDLWYAVIFVFYLTSAIWSLTLWHLNAEGQALKGESEKSASMSLSRRSFWAINAMASFALIVTLMLFFVIPRTGFGFFQKIGAQSLRTSGFSEKVDLGVIGAVKQDPSLVMRVQFPDLDGRPLDPIYFRGAAYDQYNGRSWANTFLRRRLIEKTGDGTFTVPPGRRSSNTVRGVRQQILLEDPETSVLFGMPFIHEVSGDFFAVQVDGLDGLSLPVPPSGRFQYTVHSVPNHLTLEERTAASLSYPESITAHFLQLPSISSRVADLAEEITRDAKTPYERIAAVERHLLSNYRYSLDVSINSAGSPLEDFLFRRKTGYCEHYATAMVIMLRTIGIPARLVTGFLTGEWNNFGNYYRVRQQDAHAWVEVFFPDSGWITYDPTPVVFSEPSDPILKTVGSFVDSLRLKWDRFIIYYSFRDQMSAVGALRRRGDDFLTGGQDFLTALWRPAIGGRALIEPFLEPTSISIAIGVTLGAVLIVMVMMFRAGKGKTAAETEAPSSIAVELYERMLRHLRPHGLAKSPGDTPLEFSSRVSGVLPEAGRFVAPLTHLYCRVRFGQDMLSEAERQQAETWLNDLKTMAESSKRD